MSESNCIQVNLETRATTRQDSASFTKYKYQKIKNIWAGTALWIFIFIPFLILPFVVPLFFFKYFIIFLAKIFRPDLIHLKNSVSNTFASKFCNPGSDQATNLICIWKLKGNLECEAFRKHFEQCFLSTEKLRKEYQNFYCTFEHWMFYTFKKHVNEINLQERIKDDQWERQDDSSKLDSLILGKLVSDDYGGNNKPRWDISIINIDQNPKEKLIENRYESVLIFRMDHALVDGYSIKNLFDTLAGCPKPYTEKVKGPTILQKVKWKLVQPKVFLDWVWDFTCQKPIPCLEKAGQEKLSFTSLDLAKVKKVRKETKTHYNVVLSMLQVGAIRRHLLKTGRINSEDELPEFTQVACPTRVPNHPATLQQSSNRMENHFGMKYWKVPIKSNDKNNVIDRLLRAEEDFIYSEEIGVDGLFHEFINPLAWPFPNRMLNFAFTLFPTFNASPSSHMLTTLMFNQITILDCPLQNLYVVTCLKTTGPFFKLYVCPTTNGPRLDVSVYSFSDMFQSQAELDWFTKVLLEEELEEMVAALSE